MQQAAMAMAWQHAAAGGVAAWRRNVASNIAGGVVCGEHQRRWRQANQRQLCQRRSAAIINNALNGRSLLQHLLAYGQWRSRNVT